MQTEMGGFCFTFRALVQMSYIANILAQLLHGSQRDLDFVRIPAVLTGFRQ
jgi:hypothetical protein